MLRSAVRIRSLYSPPTPAGLRAAAPKAYPPYHAPFPTQSMGICGEYTRPSPGRLGETEGAPPVPGKDVVIVVKGITRQVILVKSPDPKLFEEAIFIVKEEAMNREGVSAEQVIRQARQAADGYLKGNRVKRTLLEKVSGPVWAVGGAVAASGCWMAALYL